jgi:GH24 family phage-related lysozyme (muramidase)
MITASPIHTKLAKQVAEPVIKKWENLKNLAADGRVYAYKDPTGTPTIGWGSISYRYVPAIRARFGRDKVNMGDVITVTEADQLLKAEIDHKTDAVEKLLTPNTNYNQEGAFISLAYNAGEGFVKDSAVLSLHNTGKTGDASERWKKTAITSKGVLLDGLVNRRADESRLYKTPVNANVVREESDDGAKKKRLIIVTIAVFVLLAAWWYSQKK